MSKTYTRPTFADVRNRLMADFGDMPAVIRDALAPALAKIDHGQHGHLDWIRRQISPMECDAEMLQVWSTLYNVPRLMATFGEGVVLAKGNINTPLLIETLLRGQNGLDYKTISPAVMGEDDTPVSVRCMTAGVAGNMLPGQTLTLIDPVPGIDGTLTVVNPGLQGGADDETVDAWRMRVVEEWRTITSVGARGGRPDDYRFWSLSAHPDVTGALVFPNTLGPGTVLVYPICNDLQDRLPTQPIINAVQLLMMGTPPRWNGRVPAGSNVSTALATPKPVQVSLTLQTGYDTEANRTSIYNSLRASIIKESSEDSVLLLAEIDAAISTVTSQYVRHAPQSDIAVTEGEILTLAPVDWVMA